MTREVVEDTGASTGSAGATGSRVAALGVLALVIVCMILIATVSIDVVLPGSFGSPFALWAYTAGFILGAFALVGWLMNGRFLGFLITESNVMSASRAQWALWFVAIASTYLVLSVLQIKQGRGVLVAVGQGVLLTTMASSASLVGAQLVTANKAKGNTASFVVEGVDPATLRPKGLLWANKSPTSAALTDIFDGDELVDGTSLDASKVQMLLLTVVLVFLFLLHFFRDLAAIGTGGVPAALPEVVSETMAGVLGISHAGYLGTKLPRRTPEG